MKNIQEINIEFAKKIKMNFIIAIFCLCYSICSFLTFCFIFTDIPYIAFTSLGVLLILLHEITIVETLKSKKKLLNNKIEKIESNDKKEFDNIILYCNGEYVFTKNKIFLLKDDFSFKYDDIILIYTKYNILRHLKKTRVSWKRQNSFSEDQSLIVILKNGKSVKLLYDITEIYFYDDNYLSLEQLLLSKNEKILVGNTKENFEKLEEVYPKIDREKLKFF